MLDDFLCILGSKPRHQNTFLLVTIKTSELVKSWYPNKSKNI